jgi:hypothetical protein
MDLSSFHSGAEDNVLTASSRQHTKEPAAALMSVGNVLGSGELAVDDAEEVAAAGQLAKQILDALVRAVIGDVAALYLK